jgi:DeoR/GlpR family transcriptional regulator of sugar metabolism
VVSNFEVATLDQIHRLITDNGLDASARAELAARSVEVLIADDELNVLNDLNRTGT